MFQRVATCWPVWWWLERRHLRSPWARNMAGRRVAMSCTAWRSAASEPQWLSPAERLTTVVQCTVWWQTVGELTAVGPPRCCHGCAGLCQWRSRWTCWRCRRTPCRHEQLAVDCAADSWQFSMSLECRRKLPAAVTWCDRHVTWWCCRVLPCRTEQYSICIFRFSIP